MRTRENDFMKLPKTKLTPGTPDARVKPNHHPSEGTGSNTEAPAGQVARPAHVSSPEVQCLPTSRWGIGEPPPLPATKAVTTATAAEPVKAPATARRVSFELVAPEARTIFLAGSFNDWNPSATPMMRLHDLKWAKEIWLPAGRYEYLFVVDGQWIPDPKALGRVSNPFGRYNSVLLIECSTARLSTFQPCSRLHNQHL